MQALAIKYRPTDFSDVVGQKNIVAILTNQIQSDSIKQSYLFCGGAGTGKTTSARIFASKIDAEVLEIDGASNNGVDNVREIREKVKFKPIEKKYKVIIIDEVHMLSTGAFNALLKILEEPPSHAIFILATTDPQKIPATILSRVQRFDFKRMTVEQTVERLSYILEQEEVFTVEHGAIEYISKLSQGGMRAAISILDTCLGYKKDLFLSDVIDILGATDYELFMNLTSAIIQNDFSTVVNTIEDQHINGKDLKQFIKSFTEFVVDMMKVQLTENFELTSIPTLYHEKVTKGVNYIKSSDINLKDWFRKLSALNNSIRYENNPKTLIEGELLCL